MATTSYKNNTGVKVTKQNLRDVLAGVRVLADVEILVGVPSDNADRDDGSTFNNAARAYVHDQGSPEANIPQREFMRPGMKDAEPEVEKKLGNAMRGAMRGNTLVAEQSMHQAGLIAQSAIRKKIDDGIPPPLADMTVRRRAERGRKGAMLEMDNRMAGLAPSLNLAKPLIDTGEMRKSITYVMRSRKKRKP